MSLTFGGATSHRVSCGTAAAWSNLSAWTWCGWVYVTTVTTGRHFFQKSDTSSPFAAKSSRILTSGAIRVDVSRATASTQYVAATGTVVANEWAFLAITYDAAAAAGEVVNIYKGTLTARATEVSYTTTTDGSGATSDDSLGVLILGNTNSATVSMQGRQGPVLVFNRALSLADCQALQFDPEVTAGCVGMWNLGDNGTGTQPDLSGNGNNGTVTGATQSDNPPIRRRWGRRLLVSTPTAVTEATGTGSGSFTVGGSGTGLVDVTGAGAGSFTVAGSGTATIEVFATGTGSATVAGSGTAIVGNPPVDAVGSGGFTVAGSGTATIEVVGSASGSATVAGSGTATIEVLAAGAGSFTAAGSGTAVVGTPPVDATGAGSFTVAGSATATVDVLGVAVGLFVVSGSGLATIPIYAVGTGAFVAAGSGTALATNGAPPSTALYVTDRSGVRYAVEAQSAPRYTVEDASAPRYRATRRE